MKNVVAEKGWWHECFFDMYMIPIIAKINSSKMRNFLLGYMAYDKSFQECKIQKTAGLILDSW